MKHQRGEMIQMAALGRLYMTGLHKFEDGGLTMYTKHWALYVILIAPRHPFRPGLVRCTLVDTPAMPLIVVHTHQSPSHEVRGQERTRMPPVTTLSQTGARNHVADVPNLGWLSIAQVLVVLLRPWLTPTIPLHTHMAVN